jgi:hypothetical protein
MYVCTRKQTFRDPSVSLELLPQAPFQIQVGIRPKRGCRYLDARQHAVYELLRPNKQDVPIEQSVGMRCLRCKFESATIEASASDITRVWYLGSASRSGLVTAGYAIADTGSCPSLEKLLFHSVPGRQLSVFGRSNDQEAAYEIREQSAR